MKRLLLGAGPSPVPDRVLQALGRPTIGHMDPAFAAIMDRTAERLRDVFGTANPATLPISATGSGGMDATVANFIAPGDRVVCGVHGTFGERMADALQRAGAEVVRVESPAWGRAIPTESLLEAASKQPLDAMFVVHAETSTGVCQPLEGLAEACHDRDALLIVDCVTSLGGQPLSIDESGIDVAYSGTQKCLSAPPGLAPLTAGERALRKLRERESPVRSWYFDLRMVLGYWVEGNTARAYHHTAPVNMIYALEEALAIVLAEGLPERWARHERAHEALRAALQTLGFERLAPPNEALWPLLALKLPEGVEDAPVREALLNEHDIEVSGGLGELAGRIWRVGVMGEGARREPQERLVRALGALLDRDVTDGLALLEEHWAA